MFKILSRRLIQKYLQSSYFFGRRVVCAQTAIFFNEPVSKNFENYTFYVWRMVWCLPNRRCGIRFAWHFRGFFHQIKMYHRIGRNYSRLAACRRMRRLETFCILVAKNFKHVSKIQNQNRKKLFYFSRLPKYEEIGGILYYSG